MIGFCGVFILVIGLMAFGLTSAPRPTSISPDIYARLRQIEWVIAILFTILGMIILRTSITRLTRPPEDS